MMNYNNNNTYSVYNIAELNEKLNSFQNINNETDAFFKNFSFEKNVLNNQMAKGNSSQVFNKIIKEDTTKDKGLLKTRVSSLIHKRLYTQGYVINTRISYTQVFLLSYTRVS